MICIMYSTVQTNHRSFRIEKTVNPKPKFGGVFFTLISKKGGRWRNREEFER